MLVLTRKEGEAIMIGYNITVRILGVKGKQVKIGVEAPSTVKILREELFNSIVEENKMASSIRTSEFEKALNKII